MPALRWRFAKFLILPLLLYCNAVYAATYTVCEPGCDFSTIQGAFNGVNLAPGDILEVRAATTGGTATFREMVTWGSDDQGTVGNPVTLQGRVGDTIVITASDPVMAWTASGPSLPNVWQATVPDQPRQAYFNNVRGVKETSEASLGTEAKEWYWANSVLFVYSETDPNTAVLIEVDTAAKAQCLYIYNRSHVVVKNLTFEKAYSRGVYVSYEDSDYVTIDGCRFLQASATFGGNNTALLIGSYGHYPSHVEVKNCTFGRNIGNDVEDQGYASRTSIELHGHDCKIHDNTIYHTAIENEEDTGFMAHGIDLIEFAGITDVYNNTIYHVGGAGIIVKGTTIPGDEIKIHDNTISYPGAAGIAVWRTRAAEGTGGVGHIYNNTIYKADRLAGQLGSGGWSSMGIHLQDGTYLQIDPAHPFIKWYVYDNSIHNSESLADPAFPNWDAGGIGMDYNANNVEVYRNLIYDNQGVGIYVFCSDNVFVYRNVIHGNDAGIRVSAEINETANDNVIYNNTLYKNYNGDFLGPGVNAEIVFGMGTHGITIKNNLLYSHGSGFAFHYYTNRTGRIGVVDYNLVFKEDIGNPCLNNIDGERTYAQWQMYGFDAHGVNSDPLLDRDNYHLRTASSPARDAGEGGIVDIGAFEYSEGFPIPPEAVRIGLDP